MVTGGSVLFACCVFLVLTARYGVDGQLVLRERIVELRPQVEEEAQPLINREVLVRNRNEEEENQNRNLMSRSELVARSAERNDEATVKSKGLMSRSAIIEAAEARQENFKGTGRVVFQITEAAQRRDASFRGERMARAAVDVASRAGLVNLQPVFTANPKFRERHESFGLNKYFYASVANDGDIESAKQQAIGLLRQNADVLSAYEEPEAQLLEYTSNDPLLGQQELHYDAHRVKNAWAKNAGNRNIVVAVMDTGLSASPDLVDNLWSNDGEICNNGEDDDGNGFTDDCHGFNWPLQNGEVFDLGGGGHGSHCTGTIAATTDNLIGGAGVAGGRNGTFGVSIMVLTTFGAFRNAGFADGTIYAADNGAHIQSNSWGYTSPGSYSTAVLISIDYFTAAGNDRKGGLWIGAAGNDGRNANFYPGFYPKVVSVSAVDASKVAASFSNFGSWVDVAAVGVGVYSTWHQRTYLGYAYLQGTSMACPHVAGIAALLMSHRPGLSPEKYESCLKSTGEDISSSNPGKELGPFVLADAALECIEAEPLNSWPEESLDCSCTPVSLLVSITTDTWPGESAFLIEDNNPKWGCKTTWAYGGRDDFPDAETTVNFDIELCRGRNYAFRMFDTYGDGGGRHSLQLDGNTIYTGQLAGDKSIFVFNTPSDNDDNDDDDGTTQPVPPPPSPPPPSPPPPSPPPPPPPSRVPAEWTCNGNYYDVADGCDCGCGAYDPDCDIDGAVFYRNSENENCLPIHDVCNSDGDCISSSPAPAPPPARTPPPFGCFPSDATVVEKHRGKIAICEVTIGDMVQAVDRRTGQVKWSEVWFNAHEDPHAQVDFFIKLSMEGGALLTLTDGHYVHVIKADASANAFNHSDAFSAAKIIMAEAVEVNDIAWVVGQTGDILPHRVRSVEYVNGTGLWAPLTRDGTIVVDSVVASTYARWFAEEWSLLRVFGIQAASLYDAMMVLPQLLHSLKGAERFSQIAKELNFEARIRDSPLGFLNMWPMALQAMTM